jgi:hypothetical protein
MIRFRLLTKLLTKILRGLPTEPKSACSRGAQAHIVNVAVGVPVDRSRITGARAQVALKPSSFKEFGCRG